MSYNSPDTHAPGAPMENRDPPPPYNPNLPKYEEGKTPYPQSAPLITPQPQYGGIPQYGGAPQQFGGPAPQYGGAPQQFGGPAPQYAGAPQQFGGPAPQYGGAPQQFGGAPGNPAPQYGGAQAYSAPQQGPTITLVQQTPLKAKSVPITCTTCHATSITRVEQRASGSTFFVALLLCLIGCWPCAVCTFFSEDCLESTHYCTNCGTQQGRYNPLT